MDAPLDLQEILELGHIVNTYLEKDFENALVEVLPLMLPSVDVTGWTHEAVRALLRAMVRCKMSSSLHIYCENRVFSFVVPPEEYFVDTIARDIREGWAPEL